MRHFFFLMRHFFLPYKDDILWTRYGLSVLFGALDGVWTCCCPFGLHLGRQADSSAHDLGSGASVLECLDADPFPHCVWYPYTSIVVIGRWLGRCCIGLVCHWTGSFFLSVSQLAWTNSSQSELFTERISKQLSATAAPCIARPFNLDSKSTEPCFARRANRFHPPYIIRLVAALVHCVISRHYSILQTGLQGWTHPLLGSMRSLLDILWTLGFRRVARARCHSTYPYQPAFYRATSAVSFLTS